MRFASKEAARQFALRDNAERRLLTMIGKAMLGIQLWRSYESDRNGGNREGPARKRAATAVGVGEITLENLRFVLDSDFPDLIANLRAEKLTIDAAFKEAKTH